jgi:hypothetical protein
MDMKIDWFDSSEVEKFGTELALFLLANRKEDGPGRSRVGNAKHKELTRKLFYKVDKFAQQHKLNFYKKAKFGNAFQWALKDAGYDDAFIGELTKELLLKM